MAILSRDTSREAERVEIELLRRMPAPRKLAVLRETCRAGLTLARHGLRRRHPGAGEAELLRRRADLWLGAEMAACVYGGIGEGPMAAGDGGNRELDPLAITALVTRALESLEILYAIGGSVASSLHGEPRFTRDADILADLQAHHAVPLARALALDFYVDAEVIRDAVRRRGSFNLIHLATAFKVDIFVSKDRPFDRIRLARRELMEEAYVSTAEDILLAKLEWYREGGEVSERQWRDVLSILMVQEDRLEMEYLQTWASELEVADLLERAIEESGTGRG